MAENDLGTSDEARRNARNSATLFLYLRDGTVYPTRERWVAGGQLHYVEPNGKEGVIDLDTLDIQRTVDENARRGVPFMLKPRPQ